MLTPRAGSTANPKEFLLKAIEHGRVMNIFFIGVRLTAEFRIFLTLVPCTLFLIYRWISRPVEVRHVPSSRGPGRLCRHFDRRR